MVLFVEALRTAQERGELAPDADPAQLAFEINAMLAEANGIYLLMGDTGAFDMARRGIADRLDRAAA
jgi:hypothetical protein